MSDARGEATSANIQQNSPAPHIASLSARTLAHGPRNTSAAQNPANPAAVQPTSPRDTEAVASRKIHTGGPAYVLSRHTQNIAGIVRTTIHNARCHVNAALRDAGSTVEPHSGQTLAPGQRHTRISDMNRR